ncbi:M61 family metallopeptidase [candidate division KSB1 bacterium]|nr:M61 family metallopeptidase [candidate division KSB1 bacterium]
MNLLLRKAHLILFIFLLLWQNRIAPGYCAQNRLLPTQTELTYLLSIDEDTWKSYRVSITLDANRRDRIIFVMPNWLPGTYRRMDFCNQITNFKAYGEKGTELEFEKLQSNIWSVVTKNFQALRIIYDIQMSEHGFMGKTINPNGALIMGPSVFMYVEDHTHLPITARFRVPQNWRIATSLTPSQYIYEYLAENYENLVDSPVMMGRFQDYFFNFDEKTITITMNRATGFNIDQFLVMIRKIVAFQTALFNESPFETYIFIFNIFDEIECNEGIGHYSSSTYNLSSALLKTDTKSPARLIAANFFKLWNGIRIRPESNFPDNYNHGVHSNSLWFIDGVTSYYADLTLVRSALWSAEQFLENQARQIKLLQENQNRLVYNLEQASLNACQSNFSVNQISHIQKGHLIGLLIDLKIRSITDNRRSLDDVMRFMNWWFAKTGTEFTNDDIQRAMGAIVYYDFDEFFDRYIRGTAELPYSELFAAAAINITLSDTVGPDLGKIIIRDKTNRVMILEKDGPLEIAGLQEGDHLVSIGIKHVDCNDDINNAVAGMKIGNIVSINATRKGKPLRLKAKVRAKNIVDCQLQLMTQPSPTQLQLRNNWLGSNTP